MTDFSQGGKGKAKPEYVITFNDDIHTIIVIECKNAVKKHSSDKLNRPNGYAVDGVLYYAKFLKQEYNVIAIVISGTNIDNMKVDTFYWIQGQDTYTKLEKAKDIILEPQNYVELIYMLIRKNQKIFVKMDYMGLNLTMVFILWRLLI